MRDQIMERSTRWLIFASILSIVSDAALVVGFVLAVIQGKPVWAILAVLALIFFELGRIRNELVRQRKGSL